MYPSPGKQQHLSDSSLLCQIYADPPFLGRQKVNDPPLNSSGPPPLLKYGCSLTGPSLKLALPGLKMNECNSTPQNDF